MKIDVGHVAKLAPYRTVTGLANLPSHSLLTTVSGYGNIRLLKSPATPQGLCRIFLCKKTLYA